MIVTIRVYIQGQPNSVEIWYVLPLDVVCQSLERTIRRKYLLQVTRNEKVDGLLYLKIIRSPPQEASVTISVAHRESLYL